MPLTIVVLACFGALVAVAFARNRAFGVFLAIILAFPTWVGLALADSLGVFGSVLPGFIGLTYLHFFLILVRPRLWPWPVQVFISWPAMWFLAAAILAWPWAIVVAFGWPAYGAWVPFVLTGAGLIQSLRSEEEVVDMCLDGLGLGPLQRAPQTLRPVPAGQRPLKIVQITDPHLGPFMSVAKLRRICVRAVAKQPDLILVTGDLMTMQSQNLEVVAEALAPLASYRGKVFACHGNHDLEARDVVTQAYARHGIRLLVDELVRVQTSAGPVEILGADFVWRGRDLHLQALCEAHPRRSDALRLLLLHDPGAFQYLPEGGADLTLSGHTHGGHMGLLSLGLPHTFISLVSKVPDHGPWSRGRDRLYVHRAQGHYGYPIRLGVPPEHSLMRVWQG
ncbi:MAG: metallophosphoesterase [Nannocystaceae bacterium]